MAGSVRKQYQKEFSDDRKNNISTMTRRRTRRSESEIRALCTEFDQYIVPLPSITLSPYYNIIKPSSRNASISIGLHEEQESLAMAPTNSNYSATVKCQEDSESYLKELCAEFEKYLGALTEYYASDEYANEKYANLNTPEDANAAKYQLRKSDKWLPNASTKEKPDASKYQLRKSDKWLPTCKETPDASKFGKSINYRPTNKACEGRDKQVVSSVLHQDFSKTQASNSLASSRHPDKGATRERKVTRREGITVAQHSTTTKAADITVLPSSIENRVVISHHATDQATRLPPSRATSQHKKERYATRLPSLVSKTSKTEIAARSENRKGSNVNPLPNILDKTIKGSPNIQCDNVQHDQRGNLKHTTRRPRILPPVVTNQANDIPGTSQKPTGQSVPPLQPENSGMISENESMKAKDLNSINRKETSSDGRRLHPKQRQHMFPWQRRRD